MSADDIIHKRLPPSQNGRGPRSMCRRYGYVTARWANTTCPACLKMKKARRK